MKVIGIVTEYNPFHNGHKYQIQAARDACNAEAVICVMSGSFVQRGEPAMFDKWSRAKMAVLSGADLVIELPFVYSCQPADIFAFGALKLLNATGIVDYVCFGSELGSTEPLAKLAQLLLDEPAALKQHLRNNLSLGYTYPKAMNLALSQYSAAEGHSDLSHVLDKPNNVLGIEYIKAIKRLGSSIKPVTVQRIANDYNDKEIKSAIASATSIRSEINQNGVSDKVKMSVPKESLEIIQELYKAGKYPVTMDAFSDLLLYKIRNIEISHMKEFLNTVEGIEYRLKKYALSSANVDELITNIKTKRYTRTFIQRLLCHMLLDLKESTISKLKAADCPVYIRVLAFNNRGTQLLKRMKENEELPIITKVANYTPDNALLSEMLRYDLMSTDIYSLGYDDRRYKRGGMDYLISPAYIQGL
ncbi:MAG: nucleotidyltransferase [Bacillota bacterium]